MDKIEYLIEKHFESKHFEVEASIDYYTKTGRVNGILYQKMREMLVEACGGETSEREQANELLPHVIKSVCGNCNTEVEPIPLGHMCPNCACDM